MRILLISTGIGPWPCDGWGACENLTADFAWALQQEGAELKVLHTESVEKELMPLVESFRPNIVHCQYDDHFIFLFPILQKFPEIQCLLTTHYAYLDQDIMLIQDSYMRKFIPTCQLLKAKQFSLVALSDRLAKTYSTLGSVPENKIWILPNGTRTDLIQFDPQPTLNRAICIGKIEPRKDQERLKSCPQVDFAGPIIIKGFDVGTRYKGCWTRKQIYTELTKYSCLVLLSKAEAHPLVIGEALAAGCAILCSEAASANLPRNKPWIRIVGSDVDLNKEIAELCTLGQTYRKEIRTWTLENLDWRLRAQKYIKRWSLTAPLRIALVGPGIMPIPPTGWGAVEQLIWDYSLFLKKKGHHVDIINTPSRQEIVARVNSGNYDIVHVHYDEFWNILHELQGGKICVSSHYPYIERPEKWPRDGYGIVFNGICEAVKNHGVHLYCISVKDKNAYLKMGSLPESKVFLMQNGVNTDSFPFVEMPEFFRRSIVVAKIEPRKRQYLTYLLPQVDYVGRGPCSHSNYRGEIEPRENLLSMLTNYGNFVLLSDGENGSPLVVKEAMAAGLGVVLSESAANELPKLPWVTVIPDADLMDSLKLNMSIELNRANSLPLRKEIREWVRREWDWSKLVDLYIKNLKS